MPQASSLSCLHRFIIIFIDGAICIIVLVHQLGQVGFIHLIQKIHGFKVVVGLLHWYNEK